MTQQSPPLSPTIQDPPLALPTAPRSRSYYLLPNAFTTAGLFAGIYSIVQGMDGHFVLAAVAILIAMICDSMDGRVARLTHTQTEFGVQYDSLSDMASFGVAPAILVNAWGLQAAGAWGWLATFVYAAGAALRLARFNVQVGHVDKRFFIGLPSPAAAALVAGLVLAMHEAGVSGHAVASRVGLVALFAGLTMVTNVKFYSFKTLTGRQSIAVATAIAAVLLTAQAAGHFAATLFTLFLLYGLSGYLFWPLTRTKGAT